MRDPETGECPVRAEAGDEDGEEDVEYEGRCYGVFFFVGG